MTPLRKLIKHFSIPHFCKESSGYFDFSYHALVYVFYYYIIIFIYNARYEIYIYMTPRVFLIFIFIPLACIYMYLYIYHFYCSYLSPSFHINHIHLGLFSATIRIPLF